MNKATYSRHWERAKVKLTTAKITFTSILYPHFIYMIYIICTSSQSKFHSFDLVCDVPLKKSYGVIELSLLCMFAGQRMSRGNKWKRLTVDCQLGSGRSFVVQWIAGVARVIALIRSVQLGDVQSPCVQIIWRCDPAVSRAVYFCTVLQPCDGRFGFSFNLTFQRNTLSFRFCVARRLF